jgi:peroxiredoxin Q/BCP
LLPQFKKLNCLIYGISRDHLKSHEKFRTKESFGFELLSDVNELACRLFDVIKEKNMYGRMVFGIERSTFLIDEEGRLVAEWRKVKAQGHAKEVLEKVKVLIG